MKTSNLLTPEKSLTFFYHRKRGRNSSGKITSRHKGGGHKRLFRLIDFCGRMSNTSGTVQAIQYDPNRTARIALIHLENGKKKYIISPEGLKINDIIYSNESKKLTAGTCAYIKDMPIGQEVHCVEYIPDSNSKVARSAGTYAKIVAKHEEKVLLKLPTGELRFFHNMCRASIGRVGNQEHIHKKFKRAGDSRRKGVRPTVRGSAMNAVDHPHGGGEGRSPIGLKYPKTPWGKPALGKKTRKRNKNSNSYILKFRK